MNYDRITQLFGERFPTGEFSSCDFRPHFDGHGHNAWSEIMPAETVEATRVLGYARLAEMVDFLRPIQPLFGPRDRIQFAVGFPATVKAANRRMFKGWFPSARLQEVRPPDFAAVSGAIGENDIWFEGLWPGVASHEAEPGAAPDTAALLGTHRSLHYGGAGELFVRHPQVTQMEAVSREEFRRWTIGHGIGVNPRYPDSSALSFLPPAGLARFWVVPTDPATWPHFVASLLGGLDEWATGLLWPRSGSWPRSSRSQSYNEGVRDVVLRGAGIPDGWDGAVRFDRDNEGALVAVLFAYVAFGWCTDDDLFFVPDHARQLIQTDHHDVIHTECRSEVRVRELVTHMAAAGYELPAAPPDWTFKRPVWMGVAKVEPGAAPDPAT